MWNECVKADMKMWGFVKEDAWNRVRWRNLSTGKRSTLPDCCGKAQKHQPIRNTRSSGKSLLALTFATLSPNHGAGQINLSIIIILIIKEGVFLYGFSIHCTLMMMMMMMMIMKMMYII